MINITTILGLLVTLLHYFLLFHIGKLLVDNKRLLNYFSRGGDNASLDISISENKNVEKNQSSTIEKSISYIGKIIQYIAVANVVSEFISTILVLYRLNFGK